MLARWHVETFRFLVGFEDLRVGQQIRPFVDLLAKLKTVIKPKAVSDGRNSKKGSGRRQRRVPVWEDYLALVPLGQGLDTFWMIESERAYMSGQFGQVFGFGASQGEGCANY